MPVASLLLLFVIAALFGYGAFAFLRVIGAPPPFTWLGGALVFLLILAGGWGGYG